METKVILIILTFIETTRSALCPGHCECDNKKLEVICENTAIASIPFTLNPHLRALTFANTTLEVLDASLQFYPNIEKMNLSFNHIQQITVLNFKHQRELKTLLLSYNSISAVQPQAFQSLRKLQELDLSFNGLWNLPKEAFQGLASLRTLKLSHNNLASLTNGTFKSLSQLNSLFIGQNRLKSLSFGLPPSLITLSISSNPFDEASERTVLVNVEELDISNTSYLNPCQILTSAISLKKLIYFGANSSNLICQGMFRIKYLEIGADNQLLTFTRHNLGSFPTLKWLKITNCQHLEYVNHDAFASNNKLENIKIEGNQNLRRISMKSFQSLVYLTTLFLRNNSIEQLDAHFMRLSDTLKIVDVSSNKLNCNCTRHLFEQWIPVICKSSKAEGFCRLQPIDSRITIASAVAVIIISLCAILALIWYRSTRTCFNPRPVMERIPVDHISVQSLMLNSKVATHNSFRCNGAWQSKHCSQSNLLDDCPTDPSTLMTRGGFVALPPAHVFQCYHAHHRNNGEQFQSGNIIRY